MNGDITFKSSLGGFRRGDVIGYIEQLQNEFFTYRAEMEKVVYNLNSKLEKLEKENSELKKGVDAPTDNSAAAARIDNQNFDAAAKELKGVIDGLAQNMNRFFDRMLACGFDKELNGLKDAASEIVGTVENDKPAETLHESDIQPEAEQKGVQSYETDVISAAEKLLTQPVEVYAVKSDDDDEESEFDRQIEQIIKEYGS